MPQIGLQWPKNAQNAPNAQNAQSPKCPKFKMPQVPKVQNPQNAQNGSIFEKKKFLEKNLYDSLSIGGWLLKCTFITLQWFCVYFWCKRYSCMTETRVSWYTKVETFGKVYLVNL